MSGRHRRQRQVERRPRFLYVLEVPEPSDDLLVKRTPNAVFVAPIGTPPPVSDQPLPEGWIELGATLDDSPNVYRVPEGGEPKHPVTVTDWPPPMPLAEHL